MNRNVRSNLNRRGGGGGQVQRERHAEPQTHQALGDGRGQRSVLFQSISQRCKTELNRRRMSLTVPTVCRLTTTTTYSNQDGPGQAKRVHV